MCVFWKVCLFSAPGWLLGMFLSFPTFSSQSVKMRASHSPEIVHNMTNNCPFISTGGNRCVWCSCMSFQSCVSRRAAGGGQEVKTRVPGVEGRGGWGSRTRSPEWWRSLMSVRAHAARGDTHNQRFIWGGFYWQSPFNYHSDKTKDITWL